MGVSRWLNVLWFKIFQIVSDFGETNENENTLYKQVKTFFFMCFFKRNAKMEKNVSVIAQYMGLNYIFNFINLYP